MIWSPVTYLWPQCWKTSLSSNTDKLQHKVEVLKYLEAKDGLANLAYEKRRRQNDFIWNMYI